jgi:hypothetical protein
MLPATVVDKTRARQALEQTIRATADPALLEQTEGRRFRLRVYPPGSRQARQVRWRSPRRCSLARTGCSASPRRPARPGRTRPGPTCRWRSTARRLRASPGPGPSRAPGAGGPRPPQVVVEEFEGQRYFLAEVPWRAAAAKPPPPAHIVLLWDASGSAAQRDRGRELQALDAYTPQPQSGDRHPHRGARPHRAAADLRGARPGRWDALRDMLEAAVPDGASNPAAWLPPEPGPAHHRGLARQRRRGELGRGRSLPAPRCRCTPLSASPGADIARLQALSASSPGGRHRTCCRWTPGKPRAPCGSSPRPPWWRAASGARAAAGHEPPAPRGAAGRRRAGRRAGASGDRGPRGGRQVVRRRVEVPAANGAGSRRGLAARRWASLRVQALEVDRRLHRAEITGWACASASSRPGPRCWCWSRSRTTCASTSRRRRPDARAVPRPASRHRGVPGGRAQPAPGQARGALAQPGPVVGADLPQGAPPPKVVTLEPGVRSELAGGTGFRNGQWHAPFGNRGAAGARGGSGRGADPTATAQTAQTAPPAGPGPPRPPAQQVPPCACSAGSHGAVGAATARGRPRAALCGLPRRAPRPGRQPRLYLDAAEVFFEKGETDLGLRILSNLARDPARGPPRAAGAGLPPAAGRASAHWPCRCWSACARSRRRSRSPGATSG